MRLQPAVKSDKTGRERLAKREWGEVEWEEEGVQEGENKDTGISNFKEAEQPQPQTDKKDDSEQSDNNKLISHTLPPGQKHDSISRVVFLGTASGAPVAGKRNVSSLAMIMTDGTSYMVDCGEGTQHQVKLTGGAVKLAKLDTIFITHLHGDHCYGLFGLILSSGMEQVRSGGGGDAGNNTNGSSSKTPSSSPPGPGPGPDSESTYLTIVGPVGIKDLVLTVFKLTGQDPNLGWNGYYGLQFIEIDNEPWHARKNVELGRVGNRGLLHVTAVPLVHGMVCWGYVFKEFDKPGTVDSKAVKEKLHLNPGPAVGRLIRGETVEYEVEVHQETGETRAVTNVQPMKKGKNKDKEGKNKDKEGKTETSAQKRQKTESEEEKSLVADAEKQLQISETVTDPNPWMRTPRTLTPSEFLEKCTTPITPGKKVCVLQDSCNSFYATEACSDADLYVHEATFERSQRKMAIQKGHSTSEMAAQFANRSRAKQLVLTHFSGKYCESNPEEKDLEQFLRNVGNRVEEVGGIGEGGRKTPRGGNTPREAWVPATSSAEAASAAEASPEQAASASSSSSGEDPKAQNLKRPRPASSSDFESPMTPRDPIPPQKDTSSRAFVPYSTLEDINLLCPPTAPKNDEEVKDLIDTMTYQAKERNYKSIVTSMCGGCGYIPAEDKGQDLDKIWPDMAEVILGVEARKVFRGENGVVCAKDFLGLEWRSGGGDKGGKEGENKGGKFVVMEKLCRKPLVGKHEKRVY